MTLPLPLFLSLSPSLALMRMLTTPPGRAAGQPPPYRMPATPPVGTAHRE